MGFLWDRVFGPMVDNATTWIDDANPDAAQGGSWSFDWCRFRRHRFCYYPGELDAPATTLAGYAVWVPTERGICGRDKWDHQRMCRLAEAGPNSDDPGARTDATIPWSIGGQRWGRFDPTEPMDRSELERQLPDTLPRIPAKSDRSFHPSAYEAARAEAAAAQQASSPGSGRGDTAIAFGLGYMAGRRRHRKE